MMLLKVCVGKLTKFLARRLIVGAGSIFGYRKVTKHFGFAINLNTSAPPSTLDMPRYALESTGIDTTLLGVEQVLLGSCQANIGTRIVKSITIDMIDHLAATSTQDDSVHVQRDWLAEQSHLTDCIPFSAVPQSAPLPLHKEVVVSRINDSDKPTCQGNLFGLHGEKREGMIIHSKSPYQTCSRHRTVPAVAVATLLPLPIIPQVKELP